MQNVDRSLYPSYRHPGALALVELHEGHLRSCFRTWMAAKEAGVRLPETEDPDYASMETLLLHLLTAATGYMNWMCRSLKLPEPGFDPAPSPEASRDELEGFLEHVIQRWRTPLAGVEEEQLYRPGYPTSRGVDSCVEAMLQHAIVHPIRHEYQLRKLLEGVR